MHGATRYPIITLVLNFEMKRWDCGKSLHDVIDTREELLPYFSDYRINVFDIAFLEYEAQIGKVEKEGVTMCEILDKIEEQGRTKGRAEGRAEERAVLIQKLKAAGMLPLDFDVKDLDDYPPEKSTLSKIKI